MKIPKGIPLYGDINHRDPKCRQESTEQKEYFGWLKEHRIKYFEIAIHPKNEGKRTGQQSAADRDLGALNAGASDIIIPSILSFVCEVKRIDHTLSSISPKQVSYLNSCIESGAFACIALGSNAAIEATLAWELKVKELIAKITCK